LSKQIGILGGSFDPPQLGHILLVEAAISQLKLDHLIIVPARVSPFKVGKTITPAEHRLKMCQLAYPNFEVSDFEVNHPGVSYSVDTLEHFKSIYDGDFWLIGGSDLISGLPSWHRIEDMARMCKFAIFHRPGYDNTPSTGNLPEFLQSSIELLESEKAFPKLSSTAVRTGEVDRSIALTPSVHEYIRENGLYVID
jgi:nicotinate-nucleotide adenylyltransferase